MFLNHLFTCDFCGHLFSSKIFYYLLLSSQWWKQNYGFVYYRPLLNTTELRSWKDERYFHVMYLLSRHLSSRWRTAQGKSEPLISLSVVKCSNHWAIPSPLSLLVSSCIHTTTTLLCSQTLKQVEHLLLLYRTTRTQPSSSHTPSGRTSNPRVYLSREASL